MADAYGWQQALHALQQLTMKPIRYNDLLITVVEALAAKHGADWTVAVHRHPWFEFNYVAEGAVYTSIEGQEFRIEAGQSYLIPPGSAHSHRNAEGRGDDGFCLRFQLAAIPSAAGESFGNGSLLISAFLEPRPYALDRRLESSLLQIGCETSPFGVQTAFLQWLCRLFESWDNDSAQSAPLAHRQHDPLVQQVTLYMEEYYASNIKVQELADALHMSYRNLSRRFKQQTGLSLIEKLNDIRIARARTLLLETNMTLREIAAATGFDNEFYFSNQFHRYTLTTPGQFRKNTKKT